MRSITLIIATYLLIRLTTSYPLNITQVADPYFQAPASTYFRVKQGNSHTLDIYDMTGWEEAIQIQGTWPSFCQSYNGHQILYNLEATQSLQDHDPSKPIYNLAVNPLNGIIYGFVYNEGLHVITYFADDNRFTNIRLFIQIDQRIYASHIYKSEVSTQTWLIIVTDALLIRYDITNPYQAVHGGSLSIPSGIAPNSNVTLLSYKPLDLVIFNMGNRTYFVNFQTGDIQYADFTHQIGDIAIDLNSLVLYVVVYGGLYEENLEEMLTRYNAHTLQQYTTRQTILATSTFYIREIEARNFTLIVTQDPGQYTQQPFYIEYFRKNKALGLVQLRRSSYPLVPQQSIPDFLMIGTNYAIYWVDGAIRAFPIAISDTLYRDFSYSNDPFQALTYFEAPEYKGRMVHVIGETNNQISVLQIEFKTPTLECSPAGSDGTRNLAEADGEGKYFFDVKVIGRRCENLPSTQDPEVVCTRTYKIEMDVLDETHSGLSRIVASIIILCSVLIVIGVVVLVIMSLRYRKKRKLAKAFERLPVPQDEADATNQDGQVEVSDVHLRGFEQAAVRTRQNEQS